jgi:hypothetical protein
LGRRLSNMIGHTSDSSISVIISNRLVKSTDPFEDIWNNVKRLINIRELKKGDFL